MAYQLGGAEAFALISESDAVAAPGSDHLVRLFKHVGPCLILIDEWVAYCRQMILDTGLGGKIVRRHLSFAQALTEAVKAAPTALLVASLPQSAIEVGGVGGAEDLARLESTFGRLELTGGRLMRKKLRDCAAAAFRGDRKTRVFAERDAVVRGFATHNGKSCRIPAMQGSAYERRMEAAYPIHPELFDRLYNNWSNRRFQRTRGVLRLMAAVIHTLWARQDRSLLILPSFIPIDEPTVETELPVISRPTAGYHRGVDGPDSLPRQMDEHRVLAGTGRRGAWHARFTSVPLQWPARQTGDWTSVAPPRLRAAWRKHRSFWRRPAAVGRPSRSPLRRWCPYRYSTQPNVGYVARDRAAQQEDDDLLAEIVQRLRKQQGHRGGFAKVYDADEIRRCSRRAGWPSGYPAA